MAAPEWHSSKNKIEPFEQDKYQLWYYYWLLNYFLSYEFLSSENKIIFVD